MTFFNCGLRVVRMISEKIQYQELERHKRNSNLCSQEHALCKESKILFLVLWDSEDTWEDLKQVV